MELKVIGKRKITLVGMDFFGCPSEQDTVEQLWSKYTKFFKKNKDLIKHLIPGSNYEVWAWREADKDTKNEYIFVGSEVEKIEDLPPGLAAKTFPETIYAVFPLKGPEVKLFRTKKLWEEWLPHAGLKKSFNSSS